VQRFALAPPHGSSQKPNQSQLEIRQQENDVKKSGQCPLLPKELLQIFQFIHGIGPKVLEKKARKGLAFVLLIRLVRTRKGVISFPLG